MLLKNSSYPKGAVILAAMALTKRITGWLMRKLRTQSHTAELKKKPKSQDSHFRQKAKTATLAKKPRQPLYKSQDQKAKTATLQKPRQPLLIPSLQNTTALTKSQDSHF